MSENSAAKLTTLDETHNCVKMKDTEVIVPGIPYSETLFPITRWIYPSNNISYARWETIKNASNDVELNNGFYDNRQNLKNGLSVYQIVDKNCYIKPEEKEANKKARLIVDDLAVQFRYRCNQVKVERKPEWRFHCYKLHSNCKLPDKWELIFDEQQKDAEGILYWHGILRRNSSGHLNLYDPKTPFNEKYCDLDTGLPAENRISELKWVPHCVQFKASAYPKNLEDFNYPEMYQLYEYFAEWLEFNDDEYEDLEGKKEMLDWLTKHNWDEIATFAAKHQEICFRFLDWLQDHEDEEARELFEKITV